jgi:hypothetical protein
MHCQEAESRGEAVAERPESKHGVTCPRTP